MTPAQFTTIGQTLYGVAWQHSLAASLGIDPRTVSRYARAENPVPLSIVTKLRVLLHDHQKRLMELSRKL